MRNLWHSSFKRGSKISVEQYQIDTYNLSKKYQKIFLYKILPFIRDNSGEMLSGLIIFKCFYPSISILDWIQIHDPGLQSAGLCNISNCSCQSCGSSLKSAWIRTLYAYHFWQEFYPDPMIWSHNRTQH